MIKIADIIHELESLAHPSLQESYDNTGLILGNPQWNCSGVLCCLDALENVVDEAIALNYNLIVAHHPIIFKGLTRINGKNYIERVLIKAIKHDIAIYAIHTNLDNVLHGVNNQLAKLFELQNTQILSSKSQQLQKLYTYAPKNQLETIKRALFDAGAGEIGNYSECSFSVLGLGTFKPGNTANPTLGEIGKQHVEEEYKIEVIFPKYLMNKVLTALKKAHIYETVAYEVITLANENQELGSGLIGDLSQPIEIQSFLQQVKTTFQLRSLKHTNCQKKQIKKVAVCGGAGSFLIHQAKHAGADAFITSDIKYHEFFDAENNMLLIDIGHYESEQFTMDLLVDVLRAKFPNFAVLKTKVNTNPVHYFV